MRLSADLSAFPNLEIPIRSLEEQLFSKEHTPLHHREKMTTGMSMVCVSFVERMLIPYST